jgi:hypothetical protein
VPTRRPPSRARLRVEALETRDTPAFLSGAEIAVGADAGSPALVRLIDPVSQTVQSQFLAFGGNFFGGVRVAVGDVTGDGYPDLVCAAGPSGGPQIQVFNGQTGAVAASFLAFAPSFTGGVNVAVGDITGDGVDEIVAGAGSGGGPAVSIFTGGGTQITSFFAYDQSFQGGVRVAVADTIGDGAAEVVTAPGVTGGPEVKVWQILGPQYGQVATFAGLSPNFYGGSYLAAGDVNGDGKDEIVVGAGVGGGPQVQVFTGTGKMLSSFFAYDAGFLGGVRVGAAEMTGDGVADVLTVPGATGAAQVNIYDGLATTPTTSLFGFPVSQLTGAFVDGSGVPLNIPSTPTDQITAAYNQLATYLQANQPIVPSTIIINNFNGGGFGGFGYWPYGGFGGFGFGFPLGGFGAGFYDAPGLFVPVGAAYGSSFVSPGFVGDPGFQPGPVLFDPSSFGTPELLPSPTPVSDFPVEAIAFNGFGNTGGFSDFGYGGFDDFGYGGYGGFSDFGYGGFSDFGGFGGFSDFGGGGFFA